MSAYAHHARQAIFEQEAQLSQRGRAMLRVVKNFAKSLKVVQGYSKLHR